MVMHRRNCRATSVASPSKGSPPSEAWLFAQILLGWPIPNPHAAARRAQEERKKLEFLAEISDRHEAELRRLQMAEAEARRKRERLEWLAEVSDRHETRAANAICARKPTRPKPSGAGSIGMPMTPLPEN